MLSSSPSCCAFHWQGTARGIRVQRPPWRLLPAVGKGGQELWPCCSLLVERLLHAPSCFP